MPQALSPSCSSMWRRPVSARDTAARRPLARPPTKARAPMPSERMRTSPRLRAHAREQRHREAGAAHERVGQRQGVEAALARRLGHHGVAGQRLDQLGVDLHAHRVVPAGDVGHRTRERPALAPVGRLQLPLDLPQVPPDPVEAPVDVGAGQSPRFADLPDQQQGQQIPVLGQRVDRVGHAGPALVEIDLRPHLVLRAGEVDGGHGLVVVDERRAGDRRAVDRVDVVAGNPDPPPLAPGQIAEPVRVEGLRRHLRRTARRSPTTRCPA